VFIGNGLLWGMLVIAISDANPIRNMAIAIAAFFFIMFRLLIELVYYSEKLFSY